MLNTNWKKLVEKSQAETYVLPAGWSARDDVAEQIGCSPDNVRNVMQAAIKARTVETQVFPVWDSVTKRIARVTAYRELPQKPKAAPAAVAAKAK
jgi:hypothetical protein